MSHEIRIRQGDTLLLQLAFQDDDSNPVDLTNVALACQVRTTTGDLVAALTILPSTQTGVATVTQPTSSLWPIGTLRADIKVTTAGVVQHSETFGIRVQPAVTV